MKISEFNYILPSELVATHPVEPRDSAKLLVMNRASGELMDKRFTDLPDLLRSGDVLVFNDSKVIPARLMATINLPVIPAKAGIQSPRSFEVLLIKKSEGSTWECWVKPGRKAKVGDVFTFSAKLSATMLRREDDLFFLEFNLTGSEFYAELAKIGEMPVPPYILKARELETRNSKLKTSPPEDADDYQTIYAKAEGSVAAPTAGLHFTGDLMMRLRERGVQLEYVTLHVGLGTFQPVTTEVVEEFDIHSEIYEINLETATRLNLAKAEGRRIIAVGTTTVRVLESAAAEIQACGLTNPGNMKHALLPQSGDTSIYIYPGYTYKFVDGMITNFHLPKSSLLLLVAAFAGRDEIMNAYSHAVENKYRFYSYGDGMVII